METTKRKLLVVDDEQLILQIISDIFSNEGYEVITALNCDRALNLLKEDHFHVVLTDIRMPEKSGINLLDEIRTFNPDIPVIIMTGYASLETAVEAVKCGAFDYLFKPLDFNKLKSIIKHAAEKYELVQENKHLLKELQDINNYLELKIKERTRELTNILYMTTDMELMIKSANAQTLNIFGKDCIGLRLSNLIEGVNFKTVIPQILNDNSYSTNHIIKFDDKYLEIVLSPLVDSETGQKFGLTVVTEDISEKKKLEAQVIQSAKMSAIGQFATGLAHEFNNILSGIMGYTSFALSKTSIEKIKEDLMVVEKASSRASELVSTLLSFSRQKEGKKQIASLEDVIEDAIKLIEYAFKSDSIQIIRHYGKVPPIVMNVGEIQQVILNMALNSRDAINQGGVIAINTELDIDYVKIEFSDNGIGIPMKNLEKIFEPFFTTKKSDDAKSGTGLGLSVAYSIIERHGGRIEVSSELGKGTTFTIWLPNIQRLNISETVRSVNQEGKNVTLNTRRKGNILVIDDEEFVCDLIREALISSGHNVDTAKSSDVVLELIKKNHYDIIFLDLTINGKGAEELLREMKFFDPSSVTVIISGTPEHENIEKLIAEGAYSIIKKPFKINEIKTIISQVFGAE
jgi:DNA-binding response OmpR family regulator/nitrogen-specific signal transduction histidine kinase